VFTVVPSSTGNFQERAGTLNATVASRVSSEVVRGMGCGLFEVVANPVAPECPVRDAGDKAFRLLADGRREQPLRIFTLAPAYAGFEEKDRSSFEPGKLADLTILSVDIMKVPEPEILKTTCAMTVIGGEIVYER
jgi:hypothetical protein